MLYNAGQVAREIYHLLSFLDRISDETLDTLVGFCAGRSAIVGIQRAQASKLIKRLATTPTPTPTLDNEIWAAEIGGNIVGEVEGKLQNVLSVLSSRERSVKGLWTSYCHCPPSSKSKHFQSFESFLLLQS